LEYLQLEDGQEFHLPTDATLPAIHLTAKAVDTKPKYELPIQAKRSKDN